MKLIQRLSITQRLVTLLGIAAFGTALMVAFMMFILNGLLIDEEKRKLDAVLDSAHTIVNYYYEQVESGDLTEEEARQQAFNRLDDIRYEGAEYIFTLNRQGEMVQHPFTKSLVGKTFFLMKILKVPNFFRKWSTKHAITIAALSSTFGKKAVMPII